MMGTIKFNYKYNALIKYSNYFLVLFKYLFLGYPK